MADKQQDLATSNGSRTGSRGEKANIKTWLDETTREGPWTAYHRSADAPSAGQVSQLHALEADMKQYKKRVDSRGLVIS
ncbi:hypothetical protein MMC27_004218 [Xylographa pallens]|nr:hypothetical protein [Xylographa pallens]